MNVNKLPRALSDIADDINRNWPSPSVHAKPYIEAMRHLGATSDMFGLDSGEEIVLRFLTNATPWRGEHARRIKAELKGMLKDMSA